MFSPGGRRYEYGAPSYAMAPSTSKSAICNVLSEKRKGGPRKNCPVQLTFIEGKPYLRLCTPENVGGKKMPRVVPLPLNGAEANKKAQEICAVWAAGDKTFSSVESTGLGRLRR
jgi:hypothetical protein